MKLNTWIGPLISLVFIAWVSASMDWTSILNSLRRLTFYQVFCIFLLLFASYLIRSLRLYFYMMPQLKNQKLSLIKLTLQHNFYNNVLPMRVGEVSFVVLMKKLFGTRIRTAVGTLLWFRVLDLQVLVLIAISALAMAGETQILSLSTSILACLTTAAISGPLVLFHLNRKVLRNTPKQSKKSSTEDAAKDRQGLLKPMFHLLEKMQPGLPNTPKDYIVSTFLTLLNWMIKIAIFTFVLKQIINPSTWLALLSALMGEASTVLPIHGVAGIGTYEAAVTSVLYLGNVPKEEAVGAAICLHMLILAATAISFVLSLAIPSQPKGVKA